MASTASPSQPDGPAADPAAVLQEHWRWLRTVVLARVREPEAVEEVMAEIALAVTKQADQLSSVRRLAPWLYRIAVRQSLLYRRRAGRRRRLQQRFAERVRPSEVDQRTIDPLGWLLADEQRALVRAALVRLPRRDVEILLLKHTEGWSYRELAQHLDTTERAVESRLHRARQKLRAALASLDPTLVAPA